MRRDDDVVEREQRRPSTARPRRRRSQRRRPCPTRSASTSAVLVDELAPGDVDDPDPVLICASCSRPIRPRVSGGQGQVERDEVGLREERLAATRPARRRAPGSARARRRGRRRGRASRSPRARRATCWPMRPKPTRPSVLSASSMPPKRERSQRPSFSAACACGIWRGEREQEPDRVLGRRDRPSTAGALATRMPALRRGVEVDVVDADARAADHLEPLGALDQVGGELGRRCG